MATNKIYKLLKDKIDIDSIVYDNGNNYVKLSNIMPYTLYEDATGSTGTIQLSDSVDNYKYVEIYYYFSGNPNWGYSFTKVFDPNNKNILLQFLTDNNNYLYINQELIKLNNSSITRVSSTRWRIGTGGANSTRTSNPNNMAIYKVIGYK